jgi:hypothetical protein
MFRMHDTEAEKYLNRADCRGSDIATNPLREPTLRIPHLQKTLSLRIISRCFTKDPPLINGAFTRVQE